MYLNGVESESPLSYSIFIHMYQIAKALSKVQSRSSNLDPYLLSKLGK